MQNKYNTGLFLPQLPTQVCSTTSNTSWVAICPFPTTDRKPNGLRARPYHCAQYTSTTLRMPCVRPSAIHIHVLGTFVLFFEVVPQAYAQGSTPCAWHSQTYERNAQPLVCCLSINRQIDKTFSKDCLHAQAMYYQLRS